MMMIIIIIIIRKLTTSSFLGFKSVIICCTEKWKTLGEKMYVFRIYFNVFVP